MMNRLFSLPESKLRVAHFMLMLIGIAIMYLIGFIIIAGITIWLIAPTMFTLVFVGYLVRQIEKKLDIISETSDVVEVIPAGWAG